MKVNFTVAKSLRFQLKQRLFFYLKAFFLMPFFIGVIGCAKPVKDRQYFIEHPDQMQTVLNQCGLKGAKAESDQQCLAANEAYYQLNKLVLQYRQNPQKFGELIIQTQIQMAENQKLAAKNSTDNQVQLESLQKQYDQYMSVIRLQGI